MGKSVLFGAGGVATRGCVSHWSTCASEAVSWGDNTGGDGCREGVEVAGEAD